ncbi:MAG: S16 family serine protease [Desulfobaccales bacterium]
MPFFRKSEEERPPKPARELLDLRAAVEKAQLPEAAARVALKELERLEKTEPSVAEYSIGLNYLDFLISLPWNRVTEDNLDLKRAERILESQLYDLKQVKECVLEYLAMRTLCSLQASQVLVVDDEEIARTNLGYILRKEGHQVATAANGLEALEKAKAQEFDIILTDLKMEKMDGLQLLESVKQVSPNTEIIMVTGYPTVGTAVDALKRGAAHYLSKPIRLEELRATVREIVDRKRHLQMRRGPTLCFAGPPGSGRTAIGLAIAEALDRRFVRLSLAGLRDEAELRGQRRTHAGARPGRIIAELKRLEVGNPVFMLDEIDRIGPDFQGDPAPVLHQILDSEQNARFLDHYLEVDFDLSGAMFITTANVVEKLPAPLLDSLEVIHFPGYTENEKLHIARNYLIPGQLREHALHQLGLAFSDDGILRIIRDYTREAGLRNLEREITAICRKLARICLADKGKSCALTVDQTLVADYLGPRKFVPEVAEAGNQVGMATGLVWTELGGELTFVEASRMSGNKQLILTGSLGSVFKDSAQTALSYLRSHAGQFDLNPDFFSDSDIHIHLHLPSGANPKGGPSAGLAIALALLSLLSGRAARRDVALSGELTLSGRILPVTGIREKILAARQAGVRVVVFPRENEADLAALEDEVKEGLSIVLADNPESLVDLVLLPK